MHYILHLISIILTVALTYEIALLSRQCHELETKISETKDELRTKERFYIKRAIQSVKTLSDAKAHIDDREYALDKINSAIKENCMISNIKNID